MSAPPALPPARAGWWTRNWKWLVPILVLAVLLFMVASIGLFAMGLMSSMRSNDAYRQAVEAARSSEALSEAMGEPVRPDWYLTGKVAYENGHRTAKLSIPLLGGRENATLTVDAYGDDGDWTFDTLEAQLDSGRTIDLRDQVQSLYGEDDAETQLESDTLADGNDDPYAGQVPMTVNTLRHPARSNLKGD